MRGDRILEIPGVPDQRPARTVTPPHEPRLPRKTAQAFGRGRVRYLASQLRRALREDAPVPGLHVDPDLVVEALLGRRGKHERFAVVGGYRPHRDSASIVPAAAAVLESGPEGVDDTARVPALVVRRGVDQLSDRRAQPVGPDHDLGSYASEFAAALLDDRADHPSVCRSLEVDQARTVN